MAQPARARTLAKGCFLFALSWLVCIGSAYAVSTPNVPASSPFYAWVDKLIAFKAIDSSVYAQRPWSRNEFARLIAEATPHVDEKCPAGDPDASCAFIIEIFDALKAEFHEELVRRGDIEGEKKTVYAHWIDSARAEFSFTNSDFRAVPADNGIDLIDARVNTFSSYREGAHDVDGALMLLESEHWAALTDYVSLYVKPRFEASVNSDQDVRGHATLQNGTAKLNIGKFELLAGRDSILQGHGEYGGVLASSNARPLDLVKISNDNPFLLPWFFKHLGYNKYTFFVANLGPEYVFENAFMYGFAASLKPFSLFEIGMEHQFTFGGENSPDVNAGDLISEFFFHRQNVDGVNVGDHRIGLNMRVEIPPLRKTVLYVDGVFEDFGRESFWVQYSQQMALQAGIYVPLLTKDGKNSLRLEYYHIPGAYGRHGQWVSGLTLNGLSRGNPYSSQSSQYSAAWNLYFTPERLLKVEAAYYNNGADTFTSTPSSTGGPNRVVKTQDNPQEHRFAFEGAYAFPVGRFVLEPRLGYEFVANFNFEQNNDEHNVLAAVNLSTDFDW